MPLLVLIFKSLLSPSEDFVGSLRIEKNEVSPVKSLILDFKPSYRTLYKSRTEADLELNLVEPLL